MLSIVPIDRPEPIRLDMLKPGDGFTLWWDNSNGVHEKHIEGVVRYQTRGYVSVRIRYPEISAEQAFQDGDGKTHNFISHKVETTEWAVGTLVVPKEDVDMPRVNKDKNTPTPAVAAPAATEKAPKAKKEPKGPAGDCLCGCGQEVMNRFKPGHDARFYSQLAKLVEGKLKFGELSKRAQAEVKNVAGAQAALDAHKRPPTAANAPKAKAATAKA